MTLKAGDSVRMVAMIRIEYDAHPEHYFDDLDAATPEGMAAIDQANVDEGNGMIEDFLHNGEVDSIYIYPIEEDDA